MRDNPKNMVTFDDVKVYKVSLMLKRYWEHVTKIKLPLVAQNDALEANLLALDAEKIVFTPYKPTDADNMVQTEEDLKFRRYLKQLPFHEIENLLEKIVTTYG